MAEREGKPSGKLDEPMTHSCGKAFVYTQWYTKHAAQCDGTAPAKAPVRKRATARRRPVPVSATRSRSEKRNRPSGATTIDLSPARLLVALRARRDQYDAAISALEALCGWPRSS